MLHLPPEGPAALPGRCQCSSAVGKPTFFSDNDYYHPNILISSFVPNLGISRQGISLYVFKQRLQTTTMHTQTVARGQGNQMVNLCWAQQV